MSLIEMFLTPSCVLIQPANPPYLLLNDPKLDQYRILNMINTDSKEFVLLLPTHYPTVCSRLYPQQQLLQQGWF